MATKKITELPAATLPLTGAELFEVVQGGVSARAALTGVLAGVNLDVISSTIQSSAPSAPASTAAKLYWRKLGGHPVLHYRTSSGRERLILPRGTWEMQALWTNAVPHFWGTTASTFQGTQSNPALVPSGSLIRDKLMKSRWASNPVPNVGCGFGWVTGGINLHYRTISGTPADFATGYFFYCQLAIEIAASQRAFVGMTPANTIGTLNSQDPSTIVNSYCFGKDAGDSNYQFIFRGPSGGAVKYDTGWDPVARSGHTFRFFTYSPGKEADFIGMTVQDLDQGDEVTISNVTAAEMIAADVAVHFEAALATAATSVAQATEFMHAYMNLEP